MVKGLVSTAAAIAAIPLVAASACASLVGDEEIGPPRPFADAAADGGVGYASCAAAKAAIPNAPDGVYLIAPTGDESDASGDASSATVAQFRAYCDMSVDDGGWMLVTADMIDQERSEGVTVVREFDDGGGLIVRAYANAKGCGTPIAAAKHTILFRAAPKWNSIRARHAFTGGTSCWAIFGSRDPLTAPIFGNLFAYDPTADTIREEVRMGGSDGDKFGGQPQRCDNDSTNFWHLSQGVATRSALVILRRADLGPAGFAVAAGCTEVAAGTTSPTWWEYRDIYVR